MTLMDIFTLQYLKYYMGNEKSNLYNIQRTILSLFK